MAENKTKLPRNFNNNINIYLKNKKVFYEILSLLQLLRSEKYIEKTIEINIIDSLIKDLEDENITVLYKDDKVMNLFSNIEKQYNNLLKKYKKNKECIKVLEDYEERYKLKTAYTDFWEEINQKYNIVQELLPKSYYWVKEMLVSDINFDTRYEMFKDMMIESINTDPTNIIEILTHDDNLNRTLVIIQEFRIKELLERYNYDESSRKKLLKELLTEENYKYIKMLNKNGIDLNNLYGHFYNDMEVSTISKIFYETGEICIDLYEDPRYLNIPEEIRNNNDIYILKTIELERINELIKLNNFIITEEKYDIILERLSNFKDDEKIEDIKKQLLETISNKEVSDEVNVLYLLLTNKLKDEEEKKLIKNI